MYKKFFLLQFKIYSKYVQNNIFTTAKTFNQKSRITSPNVIKQPHLIILIINAEKNMVTPNTRQIRNWKSFPFGSSKLSPD